MAALSAELETPLNVHRWRKLEGTDPAVHEALLKIQVRRPRRAAILAPQPMRVAYCGWHHSQVEVAIRTKVLCHESRISAHTLARRCIGTCSPVCAQALQKRLLQKSEEVADRDMRLKEAAETKAELEAAAARLPGPEAAEQLMLYQVGSTLLILWCTVAKRVAACMCSATAVTRETL